MKNKMKYEPPKLILINDELAAGQGCYPGSSDSDGCWSGPAASGYGCENGSGASTYCANGTGPAISSPKKL